jgi:hypothetical protein
MCPSLQLADKTIPESLICISISTNLDYIVMGILYTLCKAYTIIWLVDHNESWDILVAIIFFNTSDTRSTVAVGNTTMTPHNDKSFHD